MSARLWGAIFAIAVAAVGGLAYVGMRALDKQGITLWFGGSPASASLLALGLPDGVTEVSDVAVMGPDGNMPEIATRYFKMAGDAEGLRSDFIDRCRQAGLGPPEELMVAIDPQTVCSGRGERSLIHVMLRPDCGSAQCEVTLEVSASPF